MDVFTGVESPLMLAFRRFEKLFVDSNYIVKEKIVHERESGN